MHTVVVVSVQSLRVNTQLTDDGKYSFSHGVADGRLSRGNENEHLTRHTDSVLSLFIADVRYQSVVLVVGNIDECYKQKTLL